MFKMLSRLFRQSRSQKISRATNRQPARIEILEDRCLLAAVVWDGGGATNNWSDPLNWDNDLVPSTGDDVTIDLAGSPYTVTLNTNIAATNALGSFTVDSSDVTFAASGRIFTVDGPSNINAGDVTWANSVWAGTGTLTVGTAASVDMYDSTTLPSRIDTAIVNNGSFLIRGNTNEWTNSSIVNSAAGTLTLRSDANFFTAFGDNQLILSDGMTNEGLIELRNIATSAGSATRLHTGTGTLINEAGGIVRTAGNTVTSNYIMYAEIDNRGLIDFSATIGANVIAGVGADSSNSGTIINSGSGTTVQIGSFNSFVNSGTIDLSNSSYAQLYGQSQVTATLTNSGLIKLADHTTSTSILSRISALDVLTNLAGAEIIFDTDNGGLSTYNNFNNAGNVTVPATRKLTVSGGTINNATGSTFEGGGAIDFNTTIFDVAGNLTTGDATYTLANSIVQGAGTFINDSSVDMLDSTASPSRVDSGIVNNGSWLVRGNTNEWTSSSIVNSATGTLTIRSDANFFTAFGNNQLFLSDGMVNEGLIELRNIATSAGSATRLYTGIGTLVNEASGTIRTVGNTIDSNHILYAEIDNRGLIDFSATAGANVIAGVGADSVNSGTIVNSGAGTTVQIGSFNSFENSGTIDLTNSRFSQMYGESQSTSTLTNHGLIKLSDSVNAPSIISKFATLDVLTNSISGELAFDSGHGRLESFNTFNNSGDVMVLTGRKLTVTDGTINSAAGSTLAGDGTITLDGSTLDVAGVFSTGNADYVLDNAIVQGTGTFTNDSSVDMFDNEALPSRVDSAIVNNGTWLVRGNTNEWTNSSILNSATGTLTLRSDTNFFQVFGDNQLFLTDGMVNEGLVEFLNIATSAGSATRLYTGTGTLVNEVGATIRTADNGVASNHILYAEIDNRGLIDFAATNSPNVFAGVGVNSLNSGTIVNSGSGTINIANFASFDNSGMIDAGPTQAYFSNAGTFTNQATGQILSAVEAEFNNVTNVFGVGTIGTQVNAVTSNVNPGLSPGIINVAGNYLQNFNSGLTVEIGGNTAGNGAGFHDQVNVAGTVTLSSNVALNTTSLGGYVPVGGDSYVIINNDSTDAVSGTFVGLAEGAVISTDFLGSGETATITYVGGTDNNDIVINIVDITPPNAPSVPDLEATSDSGDSDSDDYTNVVLPMFSGTAEAGSTVELFSDVAGSLGTVIANFTTGTWSLTSGVGLADGIHNITATATDAALNVSPASAALAITVDTSNPTVPVVTAISEDTATAGDGITSDNTLVVSGTADPGIAIEVFEGPVSLGSTIANGAGTWAFDYTGTTLADGNYNLTAEATDVAGNASGPSSVFAVTVDTAPPIVSTPNLDASSDSGTSDSDDITADNTPTVSGTAESNATVEIFDGATSLGTTTANASGVWSFTTGALADGSHDLTATSTDAAGNTSGLSAVLTITIDTAAPVAPSTPDLDAASDTGDSNTDNVTSDSTPTVSGTAEAGVSVDIFDGPTLLGTTTANGAGTWSFTMATLSDGTHNLTAVATDTAGNISAVSGSLAVMVDTISPTVTIDLAAGQADTTSDSPINFEVIFSESTGTFASADVVVGGTSGPTTAVVTGSGTTYNVTVSGMTQSGSVTIDIGPAVAHDAAGNANVAATIIDNEVTFADAIYDFANAQFSTPEFDFTHTNNVAHVVRSGNTSIASSVDVILTGGTATAGTDFTSGSLTLNFAAGETTKVVPIEFLGDTLVELSETLNLSFANFSGTGQVGSTNPTATVTIADDDFATLTIASTSVVEGTGGPSQLVFDVTLDSAVDAAFTVDYETADGTATSADGDYTVIAAMPLGFAGTAGEVQQISIDVTTDSKVELEEAISVLLSNIQADGRDVRLSPSSSTFAHDGAFDPSTEGWAYSPGVSTSAGALLNDIGTGVDSWFIEDATVANGSYLFNEQYPTGTQHAAAAVDGWILSSTVRVLAGSTGIHDSITMDYIDGSKQFSVAFDVDGNGDTVVRLNEGGFQTGPTYTLSGSGSSYHSYLLKYDPVLGSADLFVDGVERLSDYTGVAIVHAGRVGWGAAASDGTGRGHFQAVDWSITSAETPTAIGTITNDDAATVSVANVSEAETDSGQTSFSFDVTLSEQVDAIVSLQADTANGTATVADNDYEAVVGQSVNFASAASAGPQIQTVTVLVNADMTIESDEVFDLVLSSLSANGRNVTFVDASPTETGHGTIQNDDSAAATISANDSSANEAGGDGQFTVMLTQPSASAVDISYSIDGSAGNGVDFATLTGVVTVAANQLTSTIDVDVTDDLLLEGSESVVLTLTSATGGVTIGAEDSDTVTISDNESVSVEFVSADSNLTEDSVGHDVTLRLVGATGVTVAPGITVSADVIDAANGSATSGTDYAAFGTQTAGFGAGSVVGDTRVVTLDATGDGLVEPTEDVDLQIDTITGPATSIGGQATHQVTILDEDVLTVEFSQAVGNDAESAGENLPQLLVTGDVQSGHSVSIEVAAIGGTASAADFVGPSTLTVGGGNYADQAFAIPSLAITDDSVVEPSETIEFGSLTGSAISVGVQSSTSYTVLDDDSLTVEFSQATGSDSESSGNSLPQLLLTGDVQAGYSVSIDVSATGGTANGTDFVAPTTLTVGGGSFSAQMFSIPSLAIVDDAIVETDETIALGGLSGSAITVGSQASSTYTILDDDTSQTNAPPVITNLSSSNPDAANKSDDGVVTINGTFDDVDLSDVHTVTVDWGDGSTLETIPVDQLAHSFNGTHTYNDGGIYSISVTVDDGNGGTDSGTTTAAVQGIGLVDGTLYVIGTNGHDWVKVREYHGTLHVDLWLRKHHRHYQSHSHKHFDAANVGEIVVIACDGHDGIDVWASSSIPVLVDAGNGHDRIWTAGGDDTVFGGAGHDHIRTYGGNDTIDAGNGNDVIHSGSGDDSIHGGSGHDCIHTSHGEDFIDAGAGHDWIDAGDGDDIIFAGAGHDHVYAGDGSDIVFGGSGNDHIDGGNGHDLLFGGEGNDHIIGGRGNDILIGGDGRDTLCGGKGNDLLIGGSLATDWRSLFDESLLDSAIAEWASGDLADTMSILGSVLDDNDKDYLYGQQGCDTFITGNRDRWWQ